MRLIDQLLAEFLVSEVAGYRQPDPSLGLDQVEDFARIRLFRRKIVDRDVSAFPRIGDRRRAAHAGIAPGDQRLAACEPAGPAVAGFAVIWPRVHLAGKSRPWLRLLLVGRLGIFIDGILQRLLAHFCVSLRD